MLESTGDLVEVLEDLFRGQVEVGEGWLAAHRTVASQFAHIAGRTVRQVCVAAAAELPSAVSSLPPRPLPTAVDTVGEEQVRRVREAERIFVSLTGHTCYSRALSKEILPVVLKSVSVEEQDEYVRQLEAFAEAVGRTGTGRGQPDRERPHLTGRSGSLIGRAGHRGCRPEQRVRERGSGLAAPRWPMCGATGSLQPA